MHVNIVQDEKILPRLYSLASRFLMCGDLVCLFQNFDDINMPCEIDIVKIDIVNFC